ASGIANVRPNHQLPSTATSALATMPPSTPSHVLPGDTLGASRSRPNLRPMKNAPMSAAHTRTSAKRIHSAPRSRSSRNDSSATHAGTRASTPASAADHAATQRGANITHRSATIHHTSAMLSSRSRPPGDCVKRQVKGSITAMIATYARRYHTFDGRRNADHSQAPMITTSVNATTVASGGSHRTTARSSATSTAAVVTRFLMLSAMTCRRLGAASSGALLRAGEAEPAFPAGEELQRGVELGDVELRPQLVGEVELAVREIPQQKVADALLAAGANEEVRVAERLAEHAELERRREMLLRNLFHTKRAACALCSELARGLHYVPSAA